MVGSVTEYVLPLESPENVATDKEKAHTPLIMTDFAELEDGTLIDLVEDPADIHKSMLAVWKHGNVEYLDELNHDGRLIKPFPRTNELQRAMRR